MDREVLIVDDNEDIVELIEMELELENFKIHKAFSGKEGWEILNQNPSIKIILSDTNMPNGNGDELLAKVRNDDKFNKTIFYFITGDLTLNEESVRQKGAQGLFSKPFDFTQMVEKLKSDLS